MSAVIHCIGDATASVETSEVLIGADAESLETVVAGAAAVLEEFTITKPPVVHS